MAEQRVRLARHKGQLNFEQELIQALYAFGDDREPLPETVRVLDEIVTDYIIDTVHTAARAAAISGRFKVKQDDFSFAIRNDEVALGRVKELFAMERSLKDARRQFDTDEGLIIGQKGVGRGRGRRKKSATREDRGGGGDGGGNINMSTHGGGRGGNQKSSDMQNDQNDMVNDNDNMDEDGDGDDDGLANDDMELDE